MNEVEFILQHNTVHMILVDNEFQALREDVENMGIQVNIVTKEEHLPEVERQNRVLKERARAMIQTLPFHNIPKKMKVTMRQ